MRNRLTGKPALQRTAGKPGRRRSGAILLYGLVCLALLSMSLVAATQLSLAAAHFRMTDETAAQADWLADAGLLIAAEKLRLNPVYAGETWEPAAEESQLNRPARVVIRVERPGAEAADTPDASADPGGITIRVEAIYPADAVRKVTVTRSVTLPARAGESPVPEE